MWASSRPSTRSTERRPRSSPSATALTPTRARLLPAGAALVLAFMERYELEAVEVSEASLREGAVLALRQAGPAWRSQLTALTAGWPDAEVPALPAGRADPDLVRVR